MSTQPSLLDMRRQPQPEDDEDAGKTIRISVVLPAELHLKAKIAAARKRTTLSEMVAKLVEDRFGDEKI